MTFALRPTLNALALAFTAYLAAGALMWTQRPDHVVLLLAAIALFLLSSWACILWRTPAPTDAARFALLGGLGQRHPLPVGVAALAVATAALVPSATWLAVGPDAHLTNCATWSVGGVGALLAIVMVRHRPWAAWSGIVLLAVAATAWIGPVEALARGLVGAVLWVGAAQLLSLLLDRAARDTARLTDLQRSASQWLASQEGARRERRTLVQRALAVAGPVLVRTIESGGHLGEAERIEARVAEGALRDELRGAALLDDPVREQLARLRRRGGSVTVVDEGGLELLTAPQLAGIRAELAQLLATVAVERLFLRSSTLDEIAVTVVGRSADAGGEDTVTLWHEIPRPTPHAGR